MIIYRLCEIGGGEMKYQILESEKDSYTGGKEFAVYDYTNKEYICVTFSKDVAIKIKEALEKQVIIRASEKTHSFRDGMKASYKKRGITLSLIHIFL